MLLLRTERRHCEDNQGNKSNDTGRLKKSLFNNGCCWWARLMSNSGSYYEHCIVGMLLGCS